MTNDNTKVNETVSKKSSARLNALLVLALVGFAGLIGYVASETHASIAETECAYCSSVM